MNIACEIFTSYDEFDEFPFSKFRSIYTPYTENPLMIVYVRKWTDSGREGEPDFSFLGLKCVEHLYNDDYEKHDFFIYVKDE